MAIKNDENELYGSALLNSYIIESKVTKSIRIVIGQTLYNYIQETSSNEYLNDKLATLHGNPNKYTDTEYDRFYKKKIIDVDNVNVIVND
jgi:hypothetical protein